MRRICRRLIIKRSPDDVGHLAFFEQRNARRSRLVAQQAIHAGFDIAILPSPDRRFGQTRLAHDLEGADLIHGQQHYLRPPDMLLTAIPIGHDHCQTLTISRRHKETKVPTHVGNIAQAISYGNLMLKTIH